MSKNFVRILKLAEFLSEAPRGGFTKPEIVGRAKLPTSTVYRLLSEMEEAGYVYRTSAGRLLPNFAFERRIGAGTVSPEKLRAACARVSAQLQTASEVILRRGHNLLWHITDEHPLQPIRLRAHPGYVRATYELDSISRLALAYCDVGEIEQSWDLTNFYDAGIDRARMSWIDAKAKISATDKSEMQYDLLGNAKGVRRYCVAIPDPGGNLVCLLTAAEAATPIRDQSTHVARIRAILMDAKSLLQGEDELVLDQGNKAQPVQPAQTDHH